METPIYAVRGIILNQNAELLVAQRSSACKTNGEAWEFPGGKPEISDLEGFAGEAEREIEEELTVQSIMESGEPFHTYERSFVDQQGRTRTHITKFYLGMAATTDIVCDPSEVAYGLWLPAGAVGGLTLTEASSAAWALYMTKRVSEKESRLPFSLPPPRQAAA
jgi:ADP-ribose pyrophosphatase YjhB (NUDIX family)